MHSPCGGISIQDQEHSRRIGLTRLQGVANNANKDGHGHGHKKKEEPPPEPTPLDKMLQNAGPIRSDGSDKFFGLENVGSITHLDCADSRR
jgi:hypothetical protein